MLKRLNSTNTDDNIQILSDQVAKLTSSLETLQSNMHNNPSRPWKKFLCYNCQESGHSLNNCTETCKICSGDHAYFRCQKKNRTKHTNPTGSHISHAYQS